MFDRRREIMLSKEEIQRINALAKKKKQEGLTEEESQEQLRLRKQYLEEFRAGFKDHIENLNIVDPKGNDVTSDKVKKIQAERNNKEKF